jgi:SAM-dependent methyltransferase
LDRRGAIDALPTFRVNSAGEPEAVAALTLQAADQSFPFLARLSADLGHAPLQPAPIESFVHDGAARAAGERLRELFALHGSDKCDPHNYHHLYGAILSRPETITRLFEIGLGTNHLDVVSTMGPHGRPGASLRAFRDFLPNARIHGADIDRRILFTEDRIETHYIDQTDLAVVDALVAQLDDDFDLIIDDGLHAPNANLAALIFGLRKLRPGGCLVVEDIHPNHLPVWQAVAPLLPILRWRPFLVQARAAYMFVVQRVG